MEMKSIHGLEREQLQRIFSIATGQTKSWDVMCDDQMMAAHLKTWLHTPLREGSPTFDSLRDTLEHSGDDTNSLGDSSLCDILTDSNADPVLLQSMNDCARKLSLSAHNEAEHAVAFTVYYATIANAIVFQDQKIGTCSDDTLIETFTDLIEKKWIASTLKTLFSKAKDICQEKLSRKEKADHSDTDRPFACARPESSSNILGERIGSKIGRYRLLSILGEGGMGVVYLAEQEQPIRRQVALKVIKPGMDSARVIARFEAERQALALLDHPNIAQVHDAGTTESGRPYFVMEYVKGLSITEHCDHYQLSIEDRLALFQDVCHAVQHAQGIDVRAGVHVLAGHLHLLGTHVFRRADQLALFGV